MPLMAAIFVSINFGWAQSSKTKGDLKIAPGEPQPPLNPIGTIPYCRNFDCDDFAAVYCAHVSPTPCRQLWIKKADGKPGHVVSVVRQEVAPNRYRFLVVEPQSTSLRAVSYTHLTLPTSPHV